MNGLPLSETYCYLTTTGRNTGQEHTIEIWFAAEPGSSTIYMLAGSGLRADWVKNIGVNAEVRVKVGQQTLEGKGRVITDQSEELLARHLIVAKYYHRDEVNASGWEAKSLPVAIDFTK